MATGGLSASMGTNEYLVQLTLICQWTLFLHFDSSTQAYTYHTDGD